MDENRVLQRLHNLTRDLGYLRQMRSVSGQQSDELATIAYGVMRNANAIAGMVRSGSGVS